MTPSSFYKQLGLLSAVVIGGLVGFHQLPVFAPHQLFYGILVILFIGFCTGLFYWGKQAVKSENKHWFGQVFMLATFMKMLLSIVAILIYAVATKPTDVFFVVPFFFIYAIYTIFEVVFMTKIGRE